MADISDQDRKWLLNHPPTISLRTPLNMEGAAPMAKNLADFRAINDDYQSKLQSTHETMGKACLAYMEQHREPRAKRRRVLLGTIVDLLPIWREMENNAEVVLGSGSMAEQEPLYKIINSVNWPNPDSGSFAILTNKLTEMMVRVGEIIEEDAQLSAEDAAAMGREIAHLGAFPMVHIEENGESSSGKEISLPEPNTTSDNGEANSQQVSHDIDDNQV